MKSYSEKLKDPRWQKKRLKIFERDNWTCQTCNSKENTLHCHHEKYSGEPWEISDEFLITTCEICHTNKHFPKLETTKRPPMVVSPIFILSIKYDEYYPKEGEFIASDVQWRLKQLLKYKNMSIADIKDHPYYKNYFRSKREVVETMEQYFDEGCKKWNVIVKIGKKTYGQN
jgi:hypothetical protein